MPEFKPTPSQEAAVRTRGADILVSAGAGSGKTMVLTERLMAYLTDPDAPEELDRFLVITFTKAAAGELKSRIADKIADALAADPGSRRLRRQSALCRQAQIGTIHSFCAALLRENAHLLQLSPDFRILDEDRAAAMRAAALERELEASYERAEDYPGFLLLADTVGAGRDDRRLAELALTLHAKMQSHARPERWAARQTELLRADYADARETPWGREVLESAAATAAYWAEEFERLLGGIRGAERIKTAYGPSLQETAEALRELCRCLELGWDRARACFPVPFPGLRGVPKDLEPALTERVKARRAACKKAMDKLADALASESAALLDELRQTAPAMEALLALTLRFDARYAADKRRAGLVDYADLEHLSARLLIGEDGEPTELARRVSGRYREIMVDEYQDVSRVQDEIFRALGSGGASRFFVGDVKQSIYRFRLAEPEIFNEKYRAWPDPELAEPGAPRRVLLQENFRSRREILGAANSVFSRCMSRRLGDLDYDENAMLRYGAVYYDEKAPGPAAKPELCLVALPGKDEEGESPDKTALEAAFVARQIRELVASGATVLGRDGPRPIEYGDVAILLRAAGVVGGVYRRALAREGVPVAVGQGGGYFSSVEISAAMSLLAVIDNPHQDIPLIAALRSPAFLFSADELSAIRAADRDADFYGALCAAAENNEKCRAFLGTLARLRMLAADLPVEELLWELLDGLELLSLCSAMTDGEQRRANLMELTELARRFEGSGYRGLHRFVLWLRRQAERGQEPEVGGPGASAVQIFSVHKSKGLEFPVVFLCDLARQFNRQDSRDAVLVHPALGLGPKRTDLERRVEYPTLARHAIRLRLEREMLSEEMRLLYVAMTRARERLVMTAALTDPGKRIEKLRLAMDEEPAPEQLAGAAAPLDWLLAAALADGGETLTLRVEEAVAEAAAEAGEEKPLCEADAEAAAELWRNLDCRYPFAEAVELPSKVTATELKGREEPDADAQALRPARGGLFRLPDFTRRDMPLTGAKRGTATHLVLQYMDFAETGSVEAVRREIERLRREDYLTEREAAAVDAGAIRDLFASPLGERMLRAEWREREFRFSLLVDAKELFGCAPGEQVLLQGVVDCCLEEDGQLVIVDYKTDAVKTPEAIAARARSYAGQLRAYAAALGRIFEKPVKECVLYFLAAGEAVTVEI